MNISSMRLFFGQLLCFLLLQSVISPLLGMEEEKGHRTKTLTRRITSESGKQSDINNFVISTAKEVYSKINKNWKYLDSADQLSTTSQMWEAKWTEWLEDSGDGTIRKLKGPTLILKSPVGKLPEALDDLIDKPACVECSVALSTTMISCLRKIVGDNAFVLYATRVYEDLKSKQKVETFFHDLYSEFITREKGQEVPGSIFYLKNIEIYSQFKPNGNGRGDNVFCTDKERYIGFGDIYKSGEQPLASIEKSLFDLFIDEKDVEKDKEQHKILAERFKQNPELFRKMRAFTQKKEDIYMQFNLDACQKLLSMVVSRKSKK